MSNIAKQLQMVKATIPDGVQLVAVSKFHPSESILQAYEAGQRAFGESKQQELAKKQPSLPQDIEWHFIGHLQTNKVKGVVPYVHTIHSVDSERLLLEIEKQARSLGRKINCLLEIHIAREEQKYGFSMEQCTEMLSRLAWQDFEGVQLVGVMGMATYTEDEEQIRNEFRSLHTFFNTLKQRFFTDKAYFQHISMGMSGDYPIAIDEGSTIVRIGTSIFGSRTY